MPRNYKEDQQLPDGRHLDARLLHRLERELSSRRDKWDDREDDPGALFRPKFTVWVYFTNGHLIVDSVDDALQRISEEDDEIVSVDLHLREQLGSGREITVVLYPDKEPGNPDARSRSFVNVEGPDLAEVKGLAAVVQKVVSAPPRRELTDTPLQLPHPVTSKEASPGDQSIAAHKEEPAPAAESPPSVPSDQPPNPPWWREHAAKLVVGIAIAVVGAVAAAVTNAALGPPVVP